jgi:hypothetical protein
MNVQSGWIRGTHSFSYPFAVLLRKHAAFRGPNHLMVSIPPKLKNAWRFLEFTSALPIILCRFTIPNMLGRWVVGERYLPDYLVWVSIVLGDDQFVHAPESRFLIALTRKTGVGFYITADTAQLSLRSNENPEFLTHQQKIYATLARSLDTCIIDTTCSNVEDSFKKIYTELKRNHPEIT